MNTEWRGRAAIEIVKRRENLTWEIVAPKPLHALQATYDVRARQYFFYQGLAAHSQKAITNGQREAENRNHWYLQLAT